MKLIRLTAAAGLAIALAACSAEPSAPTPEQSQEVTVQDKSLTAAKSNIAFGERYRWSSGISIAVSKPNSLNASETSFPPSARVAVFEIKLTNESDSSYPTAQLSVRASSQGETIPEVVDSVQGLNGLAAAPTEVPPGIETTVTLAYAVPPTPSKLDLVVEPQSGASAMSAIFSGEV